MIELPDVAIVSGALSGHRRHWLNVCVRLAPAAAIAPANTWDFLKAVAKFKRVFLLDARLRYVIICGIFAKVTGARVAAVILATHKYQTSHNPIHVLKRWVYFALDRFAGVEMFWCISGLGKGEAPSGARTLVDINMFDGTCLPRCSTPVNALRLEQGDKPIIVSVGAQHPVKRPDLLMLAYLNSQVLRERTIIGIYGKLQGVNLDLVSRFVAAGGIVVDRLLEDHEISFLNEKADLVWCVYDETYDQTSGTFGHAFQSGKPCIVRKNSLLQKLQWTLGYNLSSDLTLDGVCAQLERFLTMAPITLDVVKRREDIAILGKTSWVNAITGQTTVRSELTQ